MLRFLRKGMARGSFAQNLTVITEPGWDGMRQNRSLITQLGQEETLVNRKDLRTVLDGRLLRSVGCQAAHRPFGNAQLTPHCTQ
jgi:hypothetical protein